MFPIPTIEGYTLDDLTADKRPAAKLLRHRLLRRSFRAWCEYFMAKVDRVPALHHLFIIDTLERLFRDELPSRNLIMLLPPGSAKSTYTSKLLPAWFLNPEQYPTELMLACSYSYTLIEGFGRAARDIVEQEQNVLGIDLSKSQCAAGDWRTTRGGGYFCAGVNAGIAGHRARLGLIDDYIGTQEEADSELIREKNYQWYHNDFWPRLLPNAWQVIIANRRHEDDLVGRLLAESNKWTLIRLPMLAEENDPLGRVVGDRLWPEWFTDEQVQQAKKQSRMWAGLYQQSPRPDEGNFFKKNGIRKYSEGDLPSNLRIFAASDWAVRKNQTNDFTTHIIGGIDTNGKLWIIDWFRQQCDTGEAVDRMFSYQLSHKPICWWQGRENITGAIAPFIYTRMRETGNYLSIEEFSESQHKETKAASIKARMEAGMVMFPKNHPDMGNVESELLTFPGGTHDDFVDALAKFGTGLNRMLPAMKQETPWNGVIPDQRLTCGWVERSNNRRERREALYN